MRRRPKTKLQRVDELDPSALERLEESLAAELAGNRRHGRSDDNGNCKRLSSQLDVVISALKRKRQALAGGS